MTILGVILAGGRSRRMGRDKAFVPIGGRPMLATVIERLAPQVDALMISANGDPARFAGFGLKVIADEEELGPLAGLLSGLDQAAGRFDRLLVAPVDTPFLPPDLAARLAAAGAPAAIAASGGRLHPVIGLFDPALRQTLRALLASGERRAEAFAREAGAVAVDWPAAAGDPFRNLNTPDDLARERAPPDGVGGG